ncbi:ATP-binding protein [Halalkalirubrum salinum]|uniref:ATP-binding protein n=1 Tax=Halalkalirubrum salinum TaxID=2563889 RepID=UPI0010FB3811|nr:ATP-binding protein [Halalkalirubrum salinum]
MSQTREQERAQLLPTKEALTALKSDVTLESAVLELCDNALDAWKRATNRSNEAVINIFVKKEGDQTQLIIRDNTGGVPRKEAAMLFGLGRTAKQNDGSIGTFGVGAKKSLVNLGVPFTIRSHHPTEEDGWRFRIDKEWFEDDHDWSVPLHADSEIQPGITEICIEDLNYEWTEETANALRERLGEAYNLFLSDDMQSLCGNNFDLKITVDNEPVVADGIPDWAFSPFDGLYPRRYEAIRLDFNHLESPVYLHITVGLLHKKDTHSAGTDVYIQKRRVVSSAQDEQGGFGDGQELLGKFNARHDRLRIIIELETNADGKELPWDTQKSSIDKHNLIMRGTNETKGVYNWLRRAAQAYYTLDADKVPRAFLESYGSDSQEAVNNGKVVKYDYSSRKRIVSDHRPNTDLPEISSLRQSAEAHATLHIRCDDAIDEQKQPAYQTQLAQESDRDIERLSKVDQMPPTEIETVAHQEAGRINELARIHKENAIRCTDDLKSWQEPRYNQYLDEHTNQKMTTAEEIPDHLPSTSSDISNENYSIDEYNGSDGPITESSQTVSDDQSESETAELFLVFTDGDAEERGAQIIDVPRSQLCASLDLHHNAGDDLVWEELRHTIETIVD